VSDEIRGTPDGPATATKYLATVRRVGLISDTHVLANLDGMHEEIVTCFREQEVGLILHLGDIFSPRVLDVLEEAAPVIAVQDIKEVPSADPRMSVTRRVIGVGGKKIGMVHDLSWPPPAIDAHTEIRFPPDPLDYVLQRKFGEWVDVVVFGHTHEELMHWHEGVFFMNPGSATYPGVRHPPNGLGTVGLLEIREDGSIAGEIVDLSLR
jgi:putative phosphoesterase